GSELPGGADCATRRHAGSRSRRGGWKRCSATSRGPRRRHDPRHPRLFESPRIIRFMSSATRVSSRSDRTLAIPVHAEPPAVVWELTGSRPSGLRTEEVAQRRTAAVQAERGNPSAVLGEIVESVVEPLQLLLVVVGVLSAIFGELRD